MNNSINTLPYIVRFSTAYLVLKILIALVIIGIVSTGGSLGSASSATNIFLTILSYIVLSVAAYGPSAAAAAYTASSFIKNQQKAPTPHERKLLTWQSFFASYIISSLIGGIALVALGLHELFLSLLYRASQYYLVYLVGAFLLDSVLNYFVLWFSYDWFTKNASSINKKNIILGVKKCLALIVISLVSYWGFNSLWHANTLNIPWAKPLNWAKGTPYTDIKFYASSTVYSQTNVGGQTLGFLYMGPYQTSFKFDNPEIEVIENVTRYYGIPKGKIVAFWLSLDKDSEKQNYRFYYAASPIHETFQLPPRPKHNWTYEMYAFFGRPKLFEAGGDKQQFPDRQGHESFYQEGDPSSFLFFIRNPSVENAPWIRNKLWPELKGIEVTEAQFRSLACHNMANNDCTPFLTENTPGLTPEQLDYVKKHPITKADFADLIEELEYIPVNR